jgi:hypothetical protein
VQSSPDMTSARTTSGPAMHLRPVGGPIGTGWSTNARPRIGNAPLMHRCGTFAPNQSDRNTGRRDRTRSAQSRARRHDRHNAGVARGRMALMATNPVVQQSVMDDNKARCGEMLDTVLQPSPGADPRACRRTRIGTRPAAEDVAGVSRVPRMLEPGTRVRE